MAIHAVGYAAPWVRCSPQLSLTRSQDSTNAFVFVQLAYKWWTCFTVARPILLPTHQPTAHGAHTESLGATHPVARTPSSWDATGNYFQLPLPAVAQGSSDMEFRIFGCCPGSTCREHSIKYGLTSLRLLQQIQFSMNNTSIIRHCSVFVK